MEALKILFVCFFGRQKKKFHRFLDWDYVLLFTNAMLLVRTWLVMRCIAGRHQKRYIHNAGRKLGAISLAGFIRPPPSLLFTWLHFSLLKKLSTEFMLYYMMVIAGQAPDKSNTWQDMIILNGDVGTFYFKNLNLISFSEM